MSYEPNWKELAKTPGYRSLKTAMKRDCRKWPRDKKSYHREFFGVINRVKSLSIKLRIPMEQILNACENERDYSWHSFYSEYSLQASVTRLLDAKVIQPVTSQVLNTE